MLEIRGLTKLYNKFLALDELELSIGSGQLYGLIGPNGAGKTTIMKIIAGLIEADKGDVVVNGNHIVHNKNEVKEIIGYMPDEFGIYSNMTALDYLELFAEIYGMQGLDARKKCQNALEFVHLESYENTNVNYMSKATKQKLCLARCIIHNPKLLILDEPTNGLDSTAKLEFYTLLMELCRKGKTILITSSTLTELSKVSTHMGIMNHGRIQLSGTVKQLLEKNYQVGHISISVHSHKDVVINLLHNHPKVKSISILEGKIVIGFTGTDDEAAGLLTCMIQSGACILSFAKEDEDIESLFVKVIEESERR